MNFHNLKFCNNVKNLSFKEEDILTQYFLNR